MTIWSLLAIALATLHALLPDRIEVDAATVALIAIGSLPWLAPVIKTLRFGDFEVGLRDLKEDVKQVDAKVGEASRQVEELSRQVKEYIFTGDVDEATVEDASRLLSRFHAYMLKLSLASGMRPDPEIHYLEDYSTAAYALDAFGKSPQLYVGKETPSVMVLRAYTLHLLAASAEEQYAGDTRRIYSALAFYFPASHLDDFPPVSVTVAQPAIHEWWTTTGGNAWTPDSDWPQAIALARLLWASRSFMGAGSADPAIASAWQDLLHRNPSDPDLNVFLSAYIQYLRASEDDTGAAATKVASVQFLFDLARATLEDRASSGDRADDSEALKSSTSPEVDRMEADTDTRPSDSP